MVKIAGVLPCHHNMTVAMWVFHDGPLKWLLVSMASQNRHGKSCKLATRHPFEMKELQQALMENRREEASGPHDPRQWNPNLLSNFPSRSQTKCYFLLKKMSRPIQPNITPKYWPRSPYPLWTNNFLFYCAILLTASPSTLPLNQMPPSLCFVVFQFWTWNFCFLIWIYCYLNL